MSEAEHLMETTEDDTCQANRDCLNFEIKEMEKRYSENEKAKCKTYIECAYCEKQIIKTTYHKKFCSTKCKDKYWNTVDEERRLRASRF